MNILNVFCLKDTFHKCTIYSTTKIALTNECIAPMAWEWDLYNHNVKYYPQPHAGSGCENYRQGRRTPPPPPHLFRILSVKLRCSREKREKGEGKKERERERKEKRKGKGKERKKKKGKKREERKRKKKKKGERKEKEKKEKKEKK